MVRTEGAKGRNVAFEVREVRRRQNPQDMIGHGKQFVFNSKQWNLLKNFKQANDRHIYMCTLCLKAKFDSVKI